jgi:hypothetical protein
MANTDIDILVLGGSGSGKTCFMLGMYDDMRLGYGGFTFSATDVDVDRALVWRFERLTNNHGDDRWPTPNDQFDHYEFSLNYALRRFMVFGWTDYRGGILRETGEPHQEIQDLTAAADMLMICAPGGLLYEAHFGKKRKALADLQIAEIQRLMEADSAVCPPALILVTKFDEFAARCLTDGYVDEDAIEERLIEAVQKQYQTFFASAGGWRVLVCPVSLGPEVATSPNTAPIEPQNMHLPVMFAYHEHARDLAAAVASQIGDKAKELSELEASLRKRIFSKERIRAARDDLDAFRERQELVAARLSIVLENLPRSLLFFESGHRAELG